MITNQRAGRLEGVGLRASDDYVKELKINVENLEEQREDLLDLSARVDVNQGQEKLSNKKMAGVIKQLHELDEQIFLAKQRLEIAQELNTQLKAEDSNEEA